MKKLKGDESLDKFRVEFEKLHQALKKSHDGEKRLMTKCRELNADLLAASTKVLLFHFPDELHAHVTKVQAVMSAGQDDEGSTAELQKELEKLWKTLDESRDSESSLKDTVEGLRQELQLLTTMADAKEDGDSKSDNSMQLLQEKNDLIDVRDALLLQLSSIRADMADLTTRQSAAELMRTTAETEVIHLKEQISLRRADSERESRKRDMLEREIGVCKSELELRVKDVDSRQAKLQASHQEVEHLEQLLHERRVGNDEKPCKSVPTSC